MHIWLDRSRAHKTDEDTIVVNPTNLSGVLHELDSYFKGRNKGGVVVFEGFEGVVSANEISRVVRFLTMIHQSCRDKALSVVVPLSYRSVPQRSRNRLMEAFESVVIG